MEPFGKWIRGLRAMVIEVVCFLEEEFDKDGGALV
jgi:hypothetical protein